MWTAGSRMYILVRLLTDSLVQGLISTGGTTLKESLNCLSPGGGPAADQKHPTLSS